MTHGAACFASHSLLPAVLSLRSAVVAAGEGEWTSDAKRAVDAVLLSCSALHSRVPELAEAAAHAPVRSQVHEVATQLEQSLIVLHHESIRMGLAAVGAIGEAFFDGFADLLHRARTLDAALDRVRSAFREGMASHQLGLLAPALEEAKAIGLTHYEQPAALHHCARLQRLQEACAVALNTLELDDLHAAAAMAAQVHGPTPLPGASLSVDEVLALLAVPHEKLMGEQLRAAVRLGDVTRRDRLQMELKDLFFERSGAMFDLGKFPRLRSAEDFAKVKKVGLMRAASSKGLKLKQQRREAFLHHQSKPIMTSLTQLDRGSREEAVNAFKNILGFCQDATYQYPMMLVQELISQCLAGGADLQTEVYIQLMKQLSGNPSPTSTHLAWQLLTLCLQCFPPDSAVEHFVERFLRTHTGDTHARTLIKLMLGTINDTGSLRKVPQEDAIEKMLGAGDHSYEDAVPYGGRSGDGGSGNGGVVVVGGGGGFGGGNGSSAVGVSDIIVGSSGNGGRLGGGGGGGGGGGVASPPPPAPFLGVARTGQSMNAMI